MAQATIQSRGLRGTQDVAGVTVGIIIAFTSDHPRNSRVLSSMVVVTEQTGTPSYETADAGRSWKQLPGPLGTIAAQGPVYFLTQRVAIAYDIMAENPPDVSMSISNDAGASWSTAQQVAVQ